MFARLAAIAVACGLVSAAPQNTARNVQPIGPGVTVPKLIRKIEPEYTPQGRDAHIQGKAVFDLVVDEGGVAREITLVSPLGFGLDENAEKAIGQWRFLPGTKDGKPVQIAATVEVHFRFLDSWYDERVERQRTSYNVAMQRLRQAESKRQENAIKTLQDLSKQKYLPAMYLVASLMEEGKLLPPNPVESLALFTAGAERRYGPSMYQIGRCQLSGTGVTADPTGGMQLIKDAAVLGSTQAQLYLGLAYEKGEGMEQDSDRARRYFRLCAAARDYACQFKLAQSLLSRPQISDHDAVQAMAWLELSADQGFAQAQALLVMERSKRNVEQLKAVPGKKRQLIPN